MKKPYRQADGFYHVDGKKYKTLFGSREQVMNGTVHKTTGGLTKADLVMNKWGRIVSAKKFKTAKKEMRLQKHGFFAKKGKFGAITRKFRGGQDAAELTDDEKKQADAAAHKIINKNPVNIPANTPANIFVAPVDTTAASTIVDPPAASTIVNPTVVPTTPAAASTIVNPTVVPTTTASTPVVTTSAGGANSGANKKKTNKGPQKYDEDGHPINKQKSNKKKSSPKSKEEDKHNRI